MCAVTPHLSYMRPRGLHTTVFGTFFFFGSENVLTWNIFDVEHVMLMTCHLVGRRLVKPSKNTS